MRIRRCASRLLGYAISFAPPDSATRFEQQLPLPPPPRPPPRPCHSGTESLGGGGGSADFTSSGQPPCELSLSPWDLMVQLGLSDPQEQEEFEETYMVFISFRASWAVPANLPAASLKKEQEEERAVATVDGVRVEPREKVAKNKAARKALVKEKENNGCELKKKKATVKAEEGDDAAGEAQLIWTCRKNDGKRWSCHRLVSQPKSLCVYHSDQKRTWCNSLLSDSESMSIAAPPPASKPSTSSKPRRKRSVVDVGEGFYYYAGFGPSRSKRQCKISSSMQQQQQQESPPPAQHNETPEDHVTAATTGQAQADDSADHQSATPCCDDDMARIAGGDEESSDGEPRVVSVNGDSKRKSPLKKRWRKPVKARSLKSLM